MRWLAVLFIAMMLAGCATRGAINIDCPGFEAALRHDLPPDRLRREIQQRAGIDPPALLDTDLPNRMQQLVPPGNSLSNAAGAADATEMAGPPAAVPSKERAVLLLSGGGQWGAFGAGFLDRMHSTGRLPEFSVVTGVSTGGLQSLFVAIGNHAAYERLIAAYSPQRESEIVDRNAKPLTVLTGSMAGLRPLRRRIEQTLCSDLDRPCMLDDLAALRDRQVAVLIGFVNATSGKFQYVDAVEVARLPDRALARRCLTGAALASAAMPVFFQQVRINRQTYYDGGVRQSVFESEVARAAVNAMRGEAAASGNERSVLPVYVVRNGPTVLLPLPLDAGGLSAADRGADALTSALRAETIVVNELEVGSIAELRLTNPDGTIRLITGDGFDRLGGCAKPADAMFDPAFMACLRAYGARVADEGFDPWITLSPIAPVPPPP